MITPRLEDVRTGRFLRKVLPVAESRGAVEVDLREFPLVPTSLLCVLCVIVTLAKRASVRLVNVSDDSRFQLKMFRVAMLFEIA